MTSAISSSTSSDFRSIPTSSDVSLATTAPRVTPTPPRASKFGEVLSSTVVRSAESMMRTLPGSPVMAVAVRSATGTGALGIPAGNMASSSIGGAGVSAVGPTTSAGGSAGASLLSGLSSGLGGTGVGAAIPGATGTGATGTTGATDATGSIESSLQQSQDMNMYYLQIQEQVNAQNRSYTTLSNVLKAEHDTVKNAIGNIR